MEESKNGDVIKGGIFRDRSTGKKKLGIMIESTVDAEQNKKEYSAMIYFDYELLLDETIKGKLTSLKSYGNLITKTEVENVETYINTYESEIKRFEPEQKASFSEMCKELIKLDRLLEEKDNKGYKVKVIENNDELYLLIRNDIFKQVAEDYDWSSLQFKRELRFNDMLLANEGRYDYKHIANEPRGICIRIKDLQEEAE